MRGIVQVEPCRAARVRHVELTRRGIHKTCRRGRLRRRVRRAGSDPTRSEREALVDNGDNAVARFAFCENRVELIRSSRARGRCSQVVAEQVSVSAQ